MALTPISLPERLTMAEASATLLRLQPLLAAADQPVIDASALQDLDSAAVAVLLDCQRRAHARGKVLTVTGSPAKLGQLARLYGVEALLGL